VSTVKQASPVYALLADGTTVAIRPATPGDFDAVRAMHEAMSRDNTYMRFFNISRVAAETEARRICRDPTPGNVALLALSGDEVVGVASYAGPNIPREPAHQPGPAPVTAEVAFAVADHMHHRGIATLLLEHLVSWARSQQITTFTAQTLSENRAMLSVFADAGLPVTRRFVEGVYDLTFPLPATALPAGDEGTALDVYLSAVAERERRAEAASLRHVLAPESVVVIGVSRRPGTAGRAILDNIVAGGYSGRLYAVNPHIRESGAGQYPASVPGSSWVPSSSSVHGLSSVLDLPEAADLAVVAVPAAAVLEVAEQCGQRGVRSLVVITSGLDAGACAELLAVCRRHGMRLVGPDGFGVAVPGIGLNATFTVRPPRAGVAGLVMQSGGLGFALVDQLSRLGIGISSFASVGPKLDVSSNDMLLWWEHDGVTKVAVLYIESFGNPRKFARTARRVGAVMPLITVLAGRSAAGQQIPALSGAEAGSVPPLASREALFEQAGIITTRGFGELIEATALLATQPVPAGRTVAIVSNVGSAGRLAADACADLGLTVHHPQGPTLERLLAVTPPHGTAGGPADMTATVCGEDFRLGLEVLAADEQVHAIIALVLLTGATGDLVQAVQQAQVGIPLVAVVLDQAESVRLLPRPGEGHVPAYGYPEAAVAAVARAASYGAWLAEPRGRVPDFPDIKTGEARALAHGFLRQAPDGGWLSPELAADLLRCYGIPLAGGEGDLTDVAARAGDLTDVAARADGIPVVVRVAADSTFGPLVVFGLGGVASEVFADRSARLTPLTDTDADQLIRSVRSAPLLSGQDGRPAADLAALRDLLLRVSRLADDLPEVAALDLDPVLAQPAAAVVADARIKLAPYEPNDPFLRRLR
jgi:acyl-CoA synthetase (NDP forming)/GNAT superfamily N-acetyltransferase